MIKNNRQLTPRAALTVAADAETRFSEGRAVIFLAKSPLASFFFSGLELIGFVLQPSVALVSVPCMSFYSAKPRE